MSGRTPKIVVIGATYIDIAVKCENIPTQGQSVHGSGLSCKSDGPGLNQAVQAALCGCDVHLISKVGACPFAQMVRESLQEYNVNTEFVLTAEAMNTGAIVTLVNSTGENATCTCTGANSALTVHDIKAADKLISEADVCLIHGQLPQTTIVEAIRAAKVNGVKVILNPARPLEYQNNTESLTHDLPPEFFSADILIPNLYEAAEITAQSAVNLNVGKLIGSDLVARGVDSAVITMGKRGCMIVDRVGADHMPAFEIELVDHTGTGDAFAGALAAYCAVKDDIRDATEFASAAGALACTKFGSIEAMPTRAEIIELLQQEATE